MMRLLLIFCLGLFFSLQVSAENLRDPMKPPAFALNKFRLEKIKKAAPAVKSVPGAKKAPRWVLSSILYSTSRQHAIINNKLVRKGEKIGGARVVSLQADHVRLVAGGKVIVLRLPGIGQSIKKSLDEKKL